MDGFRVFYDFDSLKAFVKSHYSEGLIGLVPTMGALHSGHLSLVEKAVGEVDVVVLTIFVNPKQFNKKSDLKSYPKNIEKDIDTLSRFPELLVCIPDAESVYPDADGYSAVELNVLDEVLEGKYRPGHFQGVAHVVHNLFSFIEPDKAYFGLKDAQQFAVIKAMVQQSGLETELVACKTIRSPEGLALSSRNSRLNEQEKEKALIIYNTLLFVSENKNSYPLSELKEKAVHYFQKGELRLEYLDIVHADTFESLTRVMENETICCIAAYCGEVRLIDNICL